MVEEMEAVVKMTEVEMAEEVMVMAEVEREME